MRILCNIKDFYDHLVSIYGIDNEIIYDRRECTLLNKNNPNIVYFSNNVLPEDKVQSLQSCWDIDEKGKWCFTKKMCGKFYYYVLEIGFTHIYYEIERYLSDDGKVIIKPTLIKISQNCDKISKYPMAILPLQGYGFHKYKDCSFLRIDKDKSNDYPNPILSSSYLSGFITSDFVYNELYNYFISTKNKEIKDNRNDVQKLESHGFDKKTSFRGKNK